MPKGLASPAQIRERYPVARPSRPLPTKGAFLKLTRILVVAFVLALGFGACGGDDVQAFCDSQAALEDIDPRDAEAADEISNLADEAPDEIAEDIRAVADGLESVNAGEAPENPEEIQAAAQRVQDWVDENCEEG